MYGVIDCNNFYVSCERACNPAIEKVPVVVLSNNDGCIISRSQEIKDLGFPMGAPIFQYKDLVQRNNVHVYSANFSFYADMSSRVMSVIREFAPRMELYSIDEAFVDFSEIPPGKRQKYSNNLRNSILKAVGITTSIGVAPTKTLAKIGSEIAKHYSDPAGVCIIETESEKERLLKKLPVEDVWGIGRRLSAFLQVHGIFTAYQLMCCDDLWVRKQMSLSVLRTVWELRGKPCISLDDHPDSKKSIISSRSFGRKVENITDLLEAASSFVARATEKLRQEREVATFVTVSLSTNYHKKNETPYYGSKTLALDAPTDYTPSIMKKAQDIVKLLYKKGYCYKKVTISLTGLKSNKNYQNDLFYTENKSKKEISLMKVIDYMNSEWGSGTIQFGSQGLQSTWKGKSEKRSPRYTTSWDELLTVRS